MVCVGVVFQRFPYRRGGETACIPLESTVPAVHFESPVFPGPSIPQTYTSCNTASLLAALITASHSHELNLTIGMALNFAEEMAIGLPCNFIASLALFLLQMLPIDQVSERGQ
jgi:hypothetical protein